MFHSLGMERGDVKAETKQGATLVRHTIFQELQLSKSCFNHINMRRLSDVRKLLIILGTACAQNMSFLKTLLYFKECSQGARRHELLLSSGAARAAGAVARQP